MAIALVVAAGSGERLGAGLPKAFVELGGRPMLAWTMRALSEAASIERAIVAAPPGFEARVEAIAVEAAPTLQVTVVTGGASRAESVLNALSSADGDDIAVVHDAARPLATPDLFDRCVDLATGIGGGVAARRVTDTIKRVDGEGTVTTLDRSELFEVQTPQAFGMALLREALANAPDLASLTDESQLFDDRRWPLTRFVEAPASNIKVTTPADLRFAELLLADAD